MASAGVEAKSIGFLSIEMTKNFEKALEALAGLSPAMAKFGMVAAGAANVIAKLTLIGPIVQLAQKFAALGGVIKIAFSPITLAIGAIGKVFSGIKNILMLPFGIMSKAFSGLSKAWEFITKPAEGANASAYEAAKLNMSAVQLHELEYAENASGTNGQFKSLLENVRSGLLDTEKWSGFAALGLNPQELVKGNAVDSTQKVFQAVQKRFGELGYSFNDPMAASYYKKAGLGDFMSFEDAKAMNSGFFDTTMGHFQNFMKTTQYNEKSFRMLNTRVVEVQRAFDNLHKQLSARLGPAAARVAGIFVKVLSKLGEAIFTDENIKKIETGLNAISKKIEEFFSSEDAGKKIQEAVSFVSEALRGLAKLITWIIDKTSGVTGVKVAQEMFDFLDSPEENVKRYFGKAYKGVGKALEGQLEKDGITNISGKALQAELEEFSKVYGKLERKEKGQQYEVFTYANRGELQIQIKKKGDTSGEPLFTKTLYFNNIITQ